MIPAAARPKVAEAALKLSRADPDLLDLLDPESEPDDFEDGLEGAPEDEDEVWMTVVPGSCASVAMGCVPICPLPIMTSVAFDGTPLTTTNMKAVPGGKRAAFGGIWRTCRVADPSWFMVYVFVKANMR